MRIFIYAYIIPRIILASKKLNSQFFIINFGFHSDNWVATVSFLESSKLKNHSLIIKTDQKIQFIHVKNDL